MKRFVVLVTLASASLMIAGCGKHAPPPVAKKKQFPPRTNRVAHVAVPKPKPVKPVHLGTIEYLDAKNGFRDLTFGQQETNIVTMVETSRDDARELMTCIRSNEILTLHDIPMERIEY